jgi:hypothetical protein
MSKVIHKKRLKNKSNKDINNFLFKMDKLTIISVKKDWIDKTEAVVVSMFMKFKKSSIKGFLR